MIPNEIIDQILDKIDIVEIISGYIPLKKAGQNFKTHCPFHSEKTPSFMVSPGKQIFHCFGCGAGGNAIGFLMKHERMDFIDAIRMLAEKANVALPRQGGADKRGGSSFADRLYEINNIAGLFYQENLQKSSGKKAYDYLAERGLTERMVKYFRLGFAPDSWQGLIEYCRARGIAMDMLEKAGLILQNPEKKSWYDRFRNRLIFPIFDQRGRALGFGARALDAMSMPKYINSPETHIYTKGRHLYGLNFSKAYIKKQDYAVIAEGYFDLILPYQHEIRNIVATLGTALTAGQIGMLRRLTKNVIMVYDADKAGEAAMLRSLDLLIEEDMNIRITVLPKGSDPDSFVRKGGRGAFADVLKTSKDLFDYKLGTLTAKFKKSEPRGKTRIVGEMLPTLAKIKNAVLKSSYLKKMSEELSLDEESIRAELKKVRPAFARTYPESVEREKKTTTRLAETTILAIALENTQYIEKIEKELGFGKFKDETIAAILERVSDFHKNGKSVTPARLMGYFEDSKTGEIISQAASFSQTIQDKKRVLSDCFRHIRKDNLKERMNDIQFKIKEAESVADLDRVKKLVAEYNELMKEGLRIKA